MFQETPHPLSAGNGCIDFCKFGASQSFPSRSRWGCGFETLKQHLDLGESKTRFLRKTDEFQSLKDSRIKPPMGVDSLRARKQANPLVIADGRRLDPRLSADPLT